MPEGTAFDFAGLECRWSDEYGKDDDDDSGVLNASMIGSRGLRATVRLALHNLQKLKSREEYEACRQLLGLLALCPPVDVPWSLFDGVSHASAMDQACRVRREDGSGGIIFADAVIASDAVEGQGVVVLVSGEKKPQKVPRSSVVFGPHIAGMVNKDGRWMVQLLTPQPYMRGAAVEVTGDSLEFVCATGEPCQFLKTNADDEQVVHHAVVASDTAVKGGESVCVQLPDGKKDFVARSSVSFGAHVAANGDHLGRKPGDFSRPGAGAAPVFCEQMRRSRARAGGRILSALL
jgi:hypothetical protein